MKESEQKTIAYSSVPLPDGGDTHIHTWGKKAQDYVITTRIPVGKGLDAVELHDGPFEKY